MTFKSLRVGQEFDFVEDGSIYNSFYERCVKMGPRTYQTVRPVPHATADGATVLRPMCCCVGTVKVAVYHVA